MASIAYCTKCLIPDSKPHVQFNAEGVCNACTAHALKNDARNGIDWHRRARAFDELVQWAKDQRAPLFDALVPVSGGKDSITQVHRLLNRGLRILAVNVDYGIKTPIGERNLGCIPRMGAHLLVLRPEQDLHRKLIRLGLEDFGDPDLLSHTLLHAFPLHVAVNMRIPLALLGENSAFEYGGDADLAAGDRMTRGWFAKFAAVRGMDARFVADRYGLPYDKLRIYDYPDNLDGAGTQAVFASYYFLWDSEEHLKIARGYGFESLAQPREGTYRTYVGIDEKINRVHQYLKVLKFGYGRATDHACEDIRNGRLTREQAKDLVRRYDLQPLGDDYVEDVCAYLGYQGGQFEAILERARNTDLWRRDAQGRWFIPGHLES